MSRPSILFLLIKLIGSSLVFFQTSNLRADPNPQFDKRKNAFVVTSASTEGIPVTLDGGDKIKLGALPHSFLIQFEPSTNLGRIPCRILYKLEGYDTKWHAGNCEMYLSARFFNQAGDKINQVGFKVTGESVGWNGSLKDSPLVHRRETLTVPPSADRMTIIISSAGPPAMEGVYAVANLTVSARSGNSSAHEILHSPFDQRPDTNELLQASQEWIREGTHASMAKIVKVGPDLATKALAIVDDDPTAHAEWDIILHFAPKVIPGDELIIEWNEMYSMGLEDIRKAEYAELMPGAYNFHIRELDVFGVPTGFESNYKIIVPAPFWKQPWFWEVIIFGGTALAACVGRYVIRQKIRQEMIHIKHEQALERERLRIAQDIHDDLGARMTQISLISSMCQSDLAFQEKARASFGRISQMSREMVSALYETVWTVNPKNDHLEALGYYLCQMVNQMCGDANCRCRLYVQDLPQEIQVSSQIRHNISLAVKEAVHNVLKHAAASEVSLHIALTGKLLTILIRDNGRGFAAADALPGNGSINMKQRLETIGGRYFLESQPGHGTTVHLELTIKTDGEPG